MTSPRTKAAAKAFRYSQCQRNPNGIPYDPECCAHVVYDCKNKAVNWQCGHKNGKGYQGLFCGRHASV